MSTLKSFQAQVQEAIEKGISTVEEQHKTLADKSFGYVEKLEEEAKTYSIKKVHEKHNKAVDNVYGAVRNLNKRVNSFASDILSKVQKEDAVAAKKAPAAKAAKTAKAAKVEKKEAATA